MTKASKALLIFFWIAFAAFLSASIPHVAWFFSVFEPVNGPQGWLYWSVSYGIAISIDVTVFLLSMTVAGMAKQGKKKSLIFSVWIFILVLAGLSWWVNGKYAIHFEQSGVIAPSPVTIPLWFTSLHINDVNPLLASCFQILAVAYTWIADKIAAGETPKTADELEEEAQELERKTKAKARIAEMKRTSTVENATGLFDVGAAIFGHAKSRLMKSGNTDELTEENVEDSTQENQSNPQRKIERITGPLLEESEKENTTNLVGNFSGKLEESLQESGENVVLDPELIPLISRYPKVADLLSTSGTTVHISDVANVFGVGETLVRNRVESGKIRKTKSPEKVWKDSVIAWAKKERLPKGKGKIIPMEIARNAQKDSLEKSETLEPSILPIKEALPHLGMIEQRMLDAVLDAPASERRKLQEYAANHSVAEITAYLKQQYSQYASFITESSIGNVMLVYQAKYSEEVSSL